MRCRQTIIVLVGWAATLAAGPDTGAGPDRLARLIDELGHPRFVTREAAARELAAIGDSAVGPLRTAASTSPDPEVQARARAVLDVIAARAGELELARWAGYWKTRDGVWLEVTGDRWSSATPTWGPNGGRMWVVEVGPTSVAADMLVEYGPNAGQICRAIYKLDGNRLRYCGTYTPIRATEFKADGGHYLVEFDRTKK